MMHKVKSSILAKYQPLLFIPVVICLSLIFAFSAPENELQINEMTVDRAALLNLQDDIDTIDTEVFFIVEEMPKFQGKEFEAFRSWIENNLKYPPKAENDSVSGKVYIQFIVNSKGNVVDVTVVRGVHPLLDAEAKRVTESSPVWAPGKQRGKKVCVQFTFPINFVLD